MELFLIQVTPGQEVIEVIKLDLQKRGVRSAAIVSAIGAVDHCCISNMPKENAKDGILTEYHQPLEFSGVGEVKDGKPHIHCVLGREGDEALSGHLHWARVEAWYVNVYVLPLS